MQLCMPLLLVWQFHVSYIFSAQKKEFIYTNIDGLM